MADAFGIAVLVVAALFCLATTGSAGLNPQRFARQLGLTIADPGGTNEIRAQYAGFFLAVAAVCLASLAGAVARSTALVVLAAVFGGLIAGRLVSLALNGGLTGYGPMIRALYAIDAIGFALSITALILARSG